MSAGMLENINVLDFTQVVAGPFATLQLTLQGADVIKIERPGEGDMMRTTMSEPPYSNHGTSAGYLSFNTGKRSLTLDLKAEAAREILVPLIAWADVVVENFRPGVMAGLGLDAETLMAENPALVYCSISGYGQAGPKSGRPAYDGAIQAESGMMSVTGWPDSDPLRAGFFAVDIPTGYVAAFAISSGLVKAQRTGEGSHIDLAMMDTALSQMSMQINEYYQSGVQPERLGNMSAARMVTDTTYLTSDGALAVVALKPSQITALYDVLGLEQPATVAEIAAVFETAESDHWAQHLEAVGVPCSIVRDLPAALADPQLQEREILAHPPLPSSLEPDLPDTVLTMTGTPFLTNSNGAALGPAPELGQHTVEILQDCGFDADQIAAWQRDGII